MDNNWGIRLYLNGMTNEEANKLYKTIMTAIHKTIDTKENRDSRYFLECAYGVRVPNRKPVLRKPYQAYSTNKPEIVLEAEKLFEEKSK